MKITVKQKHIDRAVETKATTGYTWSASNSCPIALAIKNRYWIPRRVVVGVRDCHIGDNEYNLPKEATDFIRKFDKGLEVKPFSFKI